MIPMLVGLGILIFSLLVALGVAITFRRVVPTNMVHVVQYRDKTVSYGRGRSDGNVYYEWPQQIPRFGVVVTEFP